jgi:hypothetical protein
MARKYEMSWEGAPAFRWVKMALLQKSFCNSSSATTGHSVAKPLRIPVDQVAQEGRVNK